MAPILRTIGAAGILWFSAGPALASSSLEIALNYPESVVASHVYGPEPAALFSDADFQPANICEPSCQCSDECSSCVGCGESCGLDCGDCCCAPVWTVKAGAIILHRSRPDTGVIVQPFPASSGRAVSGTDLSFDWAAGPDVAILRRLGALTSLEARYFGSVQNNSQSQFPTPLFITVGGSNFSNIESVGFNYWTKLDSTEINLRRQGTPRITWLAGFRWIELHDELNIDYNIGPATGPLVTSDTDNHLYGGQLGADVALWPNLRGPLSINSVFKAGVYGNDADSQYDIPDFSTDPAFYSASTDVAFVGEIGVSAAYQISRHIALRGGYQLLWIDGVALASDQVAAVTAVNVGPPLNTNGDLFYHGAMMGVDVSW